MKYPKVVRVLPGMPPPWCECPPSEATHKVVPLNALVIVRDENGEWPENVVARATAAVITLDSGSDGAMSPRGAAFVVLDALAAQEGQG